MTNEHDDIQRKEAQRAEQHRRACDLASENKNLRQRVAAAEQRLAEHGQHRSFARVASPAGAAAGFGIPYGSIPSGLVTISEVSTPKTTQQHELLQTIDGRIWAREFCYVTGFRDEDWALAWFCNAIMAAFDEANRRRDREIREFCGWLSGDLAELHAVEVPRIAESLERFNRRCDEVAASEQAESEATKPARGEREVCICAAVRLADGRVIRGHRHDDCLRTADQWADAGQVIDVAAQGFITSRNRFVNRREAIELQRAAGIKSRQSADGSLVGSALYSEDLY